MIVFEKDPKKTGSAEPRRPETKGSEAKVGTSKTGDDAVDEIVPKHGIDQNPTKTDVEAVVKGRRG